MILLLNVTSMINDTAVVIMHVQNYTTGYIINIFQLADNNLALISVIAHRVQSISLLVASTSRFISLNS